MQAEHDIRFEGLSDENLADELLRRANEALERATTLGRAAQALGRENAAALGSLTTSAAVDELQYQLREAHAHERAAAEQLRLAREEGETTLRDLSTAQEELETVRSQNAKLAGELNDAKAAADGALEDLEREREGGPSTELTTLREQVTKLRREVANVRAERDSTKRSAEVAAEQNGKLQEAKHRLEAEVKNLRAKLPKEEEPPPKPKAVPEPAPAKPDGRTLGLRGRERATELLVTTEQVRDYIQKNLKGQKFPTGVIAEGLGVSPTTAKRRIDELVEMGTLVAHGVRAGTRYEFKEVPGGGPKGNPGASPSSPGSALRQRHAG